MNENDGLLFNPECEPEPDDTWRNHAWWTCFDQTCKFGCNVEKAQKAAAKVNEGWGDMAAKFIDSVPFSTTFTADDMTEAIGEADSTGAMGAAFATARKQGKIELVGHKNSTRKTSHGRILRVWRKL